MTTVRRPLAAALAAVALAGGGCAGGAGPRAGPATAGSASATPPAQPTGPPPAQPATAPPSPTPVPVTDLTLSGSVVARVRAAMPAGPCGPAAAGFAAELQFTMNEQPSVLSVAISDYRGPGAYTIPPERVSVRWGTPPGGQFLPAVRGSLAVDPGERSGRIDAALGDGSAQIQGAWACT